MDSKHGPWDRLTRGGGSSRCGRRTDRTMLRACRQEPAMRPTRLLALLLCAFAMPAFAADPPKPKTALVIHGGAGVIERGSMTAEEEKGVRADLNAALDAGNAVLA